MTGWCCSINAFLVLSLLGFTGNTAINVLSEICSLEIRAVSPSMSSKCLDEDLCLNAAERASIIYQQEFSCHPSPSPWSIYAVIRWAC